MVAAKMDATIAKMAIMREKGTGLTGNMFGTGETNWSGKV
jgi:hypothetical protein